MSKVIVCFGDSVSNGYGVNSNESFRAKLGAINAGVNADTTELGLARIQADVLSHKPDVVTVMFGIGDSYGTVTPESPPFRVPLAKYIDNLFNIIYLIESIQAEPIILTSNALQRFWENKNMKPYILAARQVAKQKGCKLVDIYQLFAETVIEDTYLFNSILLSDEVHPNANGHELIYQAVRSAIY